jgi:hypothetical protein
MYVICEWRLDHVNQCDKLIQIVGGFQSRRAAENSVVFESLTREGRDVFVRRCK